jgi:hypothetical protein
MSPVKGTNILNITEFVDNTTAVIASNTPLLFYYALEGLSSISFIFNLNHCHWILSERAFCFFMVFAGKEAIVEKNLTLAAEKLKFELYKAGEWPEKWNLGSLEFLPDYIAIAPVGYAFQEAFWLDPWNKRKAVRFLNLGLICHVMGCMLTSYEDLRYPFHKSNCAIL